jgi:hypothetical protein
VTYSNLKYCWDRSQNPPPARLYGRSPFDCSQWTLKSNPSRHCVARSGAIGCTVFSSSACRWRAPPQWQSIRVILMTITCANFLPWCLIEYWMHMSLNRYELYLNVPLDVFPLCLDITVYSGQFHTMNVVPTHSCPPLSWRTMCQDPSGYLKLWIVLNPVYTGLFPIRPAVWLHNTKVNLSFHILCHGGCFASLLLHLGTIIK